MQRRSTGQDVVRWPAQLVGRFGYLSSTVAVADFPPAEQQREVQQLLKQRLQQAKLNGTKSSGWTCPRSTG